MRRSVSRRAGTTTPGATGAKALTGAYGEFSPEAAGGLGPTLVAARVLPIITGGRLHGSRSLRQSLS